ncbi:MAG TPA: hypothetical protein VFL47_00080, partial [Flavisolibacter sp.]|nr:hypothetical protein [Flavisolibacter sp.]
MASAKQWLKIFTPILVLAGAAAYVAYRTRRVPAPRSRWRRYFEPDTEPLDVHSCNNLQGLYSIEKGTELFGHDAVVKWSYTVERKKTQYHLSFFCQKNGTYLICEGKRQGNDILLNGYWRKAAANGTGLVRLVLHNGYEALRNRSKAFSLSGWYGYGGATPT